jgi:hypothetical protein
MLPRVANGRTPRRGGGGGIGECRSGRPAHLLINWRQLAFLFRERKKKRDFFNLLTDWRLGVDSDAPLKRLPTTNAIVTRPGADRFGHVGGVLGYTEASQVILHIHGEEERVLVPFAAAAPLKMGDTWPVLTMGRRNCVFVASGGYAGIMGRVGHVESRRITVVVLLEVKKLEVTLQKRCLLRATPLGEGA